jgi:hypothetical protein
MAASRGLLEHCGAPDRRPALLGGLVQLDRNELTKIVGEAERSLFAAIAASQFDDEMAAMAVLIACARTMQNLHGSGDRCGDPILDRQEPGRRIWLSHQPAI